MKALIERLIQAGVRQEPDLEEQKRIILVNKTGITVFLMCLIIPLAPLYFGLYPVAIAQALASLPYLLVLFLNSRARFLTAKVLLMVYSTAHICTFSLTLGEASGTHFFLLAPVFGGYLVFSPRDSIYRLAFSIFALFLVVGIFVHFSSVPLVFRDTGARGYYYFSSIITGVMCVALMHHLYMTSMQAERNLASERKKSDSLLLNILPEKIAEELKLRGAALPVHFDSATILFTDFEGFTRIAERWTPGELVHELDTCFSEFDRIVEMHGLEKLKTIGDSYMCAAGIPETTQSHALDAIKAALDMLRFIRQRRQARLAEGKEYWNIRIGLHSGPLIAGVVGKRKFAYDIWGDTVNTASRLESSGVPGAINVSEETYQLAREHFDFQARGRIEAKGKEPLPMYLLVEPAERNS